MEIIFAIICVFLVIFIPLIIHIYQIYDKKIFIVILFILSCILSPFILQFLLTLILELIRYIDRGGYKIIENILIDYSWI